MAQKILLAVQEAFRGYIFCHLTEGCGQILPIFGVGTQILPNTNYQKNPEMAYIGDRTQVEQSITYINLYLIVVVNANKHKLNFQ